MKKRVLNLLIVLCLLLSVLPTAVFAATSYELYINDFQFDSSHLTYTGERGTATYDPAQNTLTLNNLTVSTENVNSILYSDLTDPTIVIDGTVTINLLASKPIGGQDIAKAQPTIALLLNGGARIQGKTGKSTDKLVINSESVGVAAQEFSDGTTRVGIFTSNEGALSISNLTVSMTDNSAGDYAGHASFIRAGKDTVISGSRLEAQKCNLGLFMGAGANATVESTEFAMALNGDSSSGLNFAAGTSNLLQDCSGTVEAVYPLYTYGGVRITGSKTLTLNGSSMSAVAKKDASASVGGSFSFEGGTVELVSEKTGLQLEPDTSATVKGGSVTATASRGAYVWDGAKLTLESGALTLTGTDSAASLGLYTYGEAEFKGGTLTVETVSNAIQNLGTKAVSFSGGTHTLTATGAGYVDHAAGALRVSGSADVTMNAAVGIQLSQGKGGTLTLSGGQLKLNAAQYGIYSYAGAGKTTLSGGKLTVTDTNETSAATGIYARGETEFSGAAVEFRNCKTDLSSGNAANRLTAGKLSLSGSTGMLVASGFEMTGGEIESNGCSIALILSSGTTAFKNGKLTLNAGYPFYITSGGTVDFAGAEVKATATANCALFVDGETEGNSYRVSGGSVVLQSTQAGANALYTAIPSGYGVWAGASEATAVYIPTPMQPILATNKYVRIAERETYKLTLVNVKEGTEADHAAGDALSYTAQDAPSGRHFSHWELTVGNKTTTVGTDAVYSGTMPGENAKLEAVYEDCSGGTADCTHRAVCSVCGKEYGALGAHRYTAETVDEKYLKSEADCENAAVYYKSCAVCGASSKGTEFEATFESGAKGEHDWGSWSSNGDGTHTRTCKINSAHTETKNCHGGTADCSHKAVCDDCGGEYGALGTHSYTAETVDGKYLKSEADCENAAVYYKSCTGCGATSKGTEAEATFTSGGPLSHDWGDWISNGDGTHTRTCKHDASHTVTRPCYGGDATCQHKAVCTVCHGEYGELGDHSYGAEVVDEKYFKADATCAHGTLYYRSCSYCGESSEGKGYGYESTFEVGSRGEHQRVAIPETELLTQGERCSACGEILTVPQPKGSSFWTDDGNYDAVLYASAPGDWVISDAADLAALAKKVNDGFTFEDCTVTLAADIDLSGHRWNPIGCWYFDTIYVSAPFKGTFDGRMHKITGMFACPQDYSHQFLEAALFGKTDNATICNVQVSGTVFFNYTQESSGCAAGLVAHLTGGSVRNCSFVGSVCLVNSTDASYAQYAGGLIGELSNSTVENCYAIADVTLSAPNSSNWVGGLFANADGFNGAAAISSCYTVCRLSNRASNDHVGAIGASVYSGVTVSDCYAQSDYIVFGSEEPRAVNGTLLSKSDMQSAVVVDALNEGVKKHASRALCGWVLDPAQNDGYPTFGAAVWFEDGAKGELLDCQVVPFGGTVTAPATLPQDETYEITGWCTDTAGKHDFDLTQPITGNLTLYAKWTLRADHTHIPGACKIGSDGLHDYLCTLCGDFFDCAYTTDVVPPTCTAAGYTVHTCTVCGNSYIDTIVEGGHQWAPHVHAPTHTKMGYTQYECSVCGQSYKSDYVEPLGHSFDDGTVTKEATCTAEGEMTYSCSCGATHVVPIPKADHELAEAVTAPTCTELGFTTHSCKHCDYSYTDRYVGATGHKWDGGKVASAPTLTETGTLVQSCTVCGATQEQKIPMLTSCDGGEGCPSSAYVDVPAKDNWAHVGIDFVLKSGLFYGTSDTTFEPDGEMTRAMLVTVLYRLEGQPKVTAENPFTDVPSGTWYTNAVLWAAENEIVNGIGDGLFDPDGSVTREQMAAILYRYSGFKGLTRAEGGFAAEYPDEGAISAYALNAMRWANAEALINGTELGGTVCLDPQGCATRAQVAAILMRYVQNVLSK